MGPEKNSKLFNATAEPRLAALQREFIRRNLVTQTLSDISKQFDSVRSDTHPVAEPTLAGKLHALAQVQRTGIGITDFIPSDFFDHKGSVSAKLAPHHDQFNDEDGNVFRTRVLALTSESGNNRVEMFGLNIYQANPIEEDMPVNGPVAKGLLLMSTTGTVTDNTRVISGETVAFGVRNKITGEAKMYNVTAKEESPEPHAPAHSYSDGLKSLVVIADGQQYEIELLTGELEQQMCAELEDANRALQAIALSPEEQAAVDSTIR